MRSLRYDAFQTFCKRCVASEETFTQKGRSHKVASDLYILQKALTFIAQRGSKIVRKQLLYPNICWTFFVHIKANKTGTAGLAWKVVGR